MAIKWSILILLSSLLCVLLLGCSGEATLEQLIETNKPIPESMFVELLESTYFPNPGPVGANSGGHHLVETVAPGGRKVLVSAYYQWQAKQDVCNETVRVIFIDAKAFQDKYRSKKYLDEELRKAKERVMNFSSALMIGLPEKISSEAKAYRGTTAAFIIQRDCYEMNDTQACILNVRTACPNQPAGSISDYAKNY